MMQHLATGCMEGYGGVAQRVMGGIPKFLRFGALDLSSTYDSDTGGVMNETSGMLPNRADMGTPWARADLFFLKDSLERGMSVAEIAGFLARTVDEAREKAKALNR